jgi:hypothetical protein
MTRQIAGYDTAEQIAATDRRAELLAQLHTACRGHEIEDCVYVLTTLLADTILADASDDQGVAFKQLDSTIVLMRAALERLANARQCNSSTH